MDVLWAPWRMAYIGGPATRGCIFCDALTGDPRERLLLATTASSVVMLNRYPYASGHLMVSPRRHTSDLPGMDAAEYAELGLSDATPDDDVLRAMAEHPILIERPIVIRGGRGVVARPPEKAREIL